MSHRIRRIATLVLACYALLLAISFVVRQRKTRPENAAGDTARVAAANARAVGEVEDRVIVPVVEGEHTRPVPVEIAYSQFATDRRSDTPILLIHGTERRRRQNHIGCQYRRGTCQKRHESCRCGF
jgi:hypothetical protein